MAGPPRLPRGPSSPPSSRALRRSASRRRCTAAPRARRRRPGQADVVQVEAADRDLVTVDELVPVDALAVQEDPVEAAVVEDAHRSRLAVDERVAARHGRVVEAHVRRQRAAQPGPALLQREHVHAVVLVGHVVARLDQRVARLGSQSGVSPAGIAIGSAVGAVPEDRSALEGGAAAVRTLRHLVHLVQRDAEPALLATKAPGACQRAHAEALHTSSAVDKCGS